MASPAASRRNHVTPAGLLPASRGHAARGHALPRIPDDAIEPFLDTVAQAFRASVLKKREHGFLAYAPGDDGMPLVPEALTAGGRSDISWEWKHPDATVAFSFHTHPGRDALCVPSGIDALGALIRGDHLVYVLTMDGRLAGWRFRAPAGHPRAVDDALLALDKAGAFRRAFVEFLYDAFDAMRPDLLEPTYAARLKLVDDGNGARHERVAPDRAFFTREELPQP